MARGGGMITQQGGDPMGGMGQGTNALMQILMQREQLEVAKEAQKVAKGELKLKQEAAQVMEAERMAEQQASLGQLQSLMQNPEMMAHLEENAAHLIAPAQQAIQHSQVPPGLGSATEDSGTVMQRQRVALAQASGMNAKILEERQRKFSNRALGEMRKAALSGVDTSTEEGRQLAEQFAAGFDMVAAAVRTGQQELPDALAMLEVLGTPPGVQDVLELQVAKVTIANMQDARQSDAWATSQLGLNVPEGVHIVGATDALLRQRELEIDFNNKWRLEMQRRKTLSDQSKAEMLNGLSDVYGSWVKIGLGIQAGNPEQNIPPDPNFDVNSFAVSQTRGWYSDLGMDEAVAQLEAGQIEREFARQEVRHFGYKVQSDVFQRMFDSDEMNIRSRTQTGRRLDNMHVAVRGWLGLEPRRNTASDRQVREALEDAREHFFAEGRARGFDESLLRVEWNRSKEDMATFFSEAPGELIADYDFHLFSRWWSERARAKAQVEVFGQDVARRTQPNAWQNVGEGVTSRDRATRQRRMVTGGN